VGGGGIVIECFRKEVPTRKYALKSPRLSVLNTDATQKALNREENERAAKLSHENVVLLISSANISVDAGSPIWAQLMEWVDGAEDLATFIYKNGETPSHLISLFCGALSGLEYIHSQGLIHWDIKTANCLVSKHGVVKIADIGNARDEMGLDKKNEKDEIAYRECPSN